MYMFSWRKERERSFIGFSGNKSRLSARAIICRRDTTISLNLHRNSCFFFPPCRCKIVQLLIIATAFVSIYTLVFMSLDRFLAVVYPIESMTWRTEANCRVTILVTWYRINKTFHAFSCTNVFVCSCSGLPLSSSASPSPSPTDR